VVLGEKDTNATVKNRFMAAIFLHMPIEVRSRKPFPALTLDRPMVVIKIHVNLKEATKISYRQED
jgi:hypothetical protein